MYSEHFLHGLGPTLAAIKALAGGRAKGRESRHGPTGSQLLWGTNQVSLAYNANHGLEVAKFHQNM